MPVEIQPETFSIVEFDADELSALIERLAHDVGLPADATIVVKVDESTPLGHATVASVDPIVLELESGALEDAKRPRHLDPKSATEVLGRLLYEVRDRLDPGFGEVDSEDDLDLAEATAWQAYCVGRLDRLGYQVQRKRRQYHFRNRHGFTDVADAAFDRLWGADGLSWADITTISDEARSAST